MIEREHCKGRFTSFPAWRCPACEQGVLECERSGISRWPAKGVVEGIDEGYLFRSDDYGAFSVTTKCSNQRCRQGVAVLGDYSAYELSEPTMAFDIRYTVRGIYPALLLINLPTATPATISTALKRSFGLFWSDEQACAGAIRVAIEGIVEHLGEPRSAQGKFAPLGARLARLRGSHPDVVEAADAIKTVGNDGAHGDAVDQEKLLSCYELLEIELRTMINDDAPRRQELLKKLRNEK
jgi:Domain of unknown function (DUF4145)